METFKNIITLSKQGKVDKAKQKCKKHLDNIKIASYYVKLLVDTGEIEEAKKICKSRLKDGPLLNQYLLILLNEEKYEEARELCEKNLIHDEVLSVYVNVLSYYNETEKIKKIVDEHPYNKYVARAAATYFYNNKDYEEATRICEKHPFDKCLNYIFAKINYPDGINVNIKYEETMYDKIKKLINNKRYKEAKELCKEYMDEDKAIYDLYLLAIENERINRLKLAKEI